MFGYIRPYKPELKMSEYDTYKAIYCGLCKQLGKVYGPFSRLTLSYDFTFLSLVSMAMSDKCGGFTKCSCVANPFKKKACAVLCDDLSFAACCAMIMLYYKVMDNYHDSGFWGKTKSVLLMPFAKSARKKAIKQYPKVDEIVSKAMIEQFELEKDTQTSIDKAAHPTATALAGIFELIADEKCKPVLSRFGYLIGRYVYLIDAFDDIEDDIKTGSFNPYLNKFNGQNKSIDEIKDYAKMVINLTVGEIAPAYELIDFKRYKSILDNNIYFGLHNTIKLVLQKKEIKDEKSI